jgi:2-amino-4-hydroxy-6-hydroxymethyldihydropteridine diphosphokinase
VATCLVAVGSNLGNREQTLDRAVQVLTQVEGLRLLRRSRWRETSPVGGPPGQGSFLNGALLVETALPAPRLLEVFQAVELQFGRQRRQRWGPRSLDLDLLLYDRLILQTAELCIPHPRMAWRRFVLEPANEIAPEMVHPSLGWTIARLWEHLTTATPYLAIAGPPAAGKTELAGQVARTLDARLILDPHSLRPSAGVAGSDSDAEMQILDLRAKLLATQSAAETNRARWSVSDFWLPQSLAYAGVRLSAARQAAFRSYWEQRTGTALAPKLTALLDPAGQTTPGREEVRRAILAQARQPGQGPLLQLTGLTLSDAVAEVLAAIHSMG